MICKGDAQQRAPICCHAAAARLSLHRQSRKGRHGKNGARLNPGNAAQDSTKHVHAGSRLFQTGAQGMK